VVDVTKTSVDVEKNDRGKVVKITFLNYEKPVVFRIINGLPKRTDKDGPRLPSEEYSKLFRQAVGIYTGSKKKPVANGAKRIMKSTKESLAAQVEAAPLDAKIEKYRNRHKKLSWTEAMNCVLRMEEPPALLPDMVEWYQHFLSCGVKFLFDGWLATSLLIRLPKKKITWRWQKIPNLPAAIRMQDHIIDGYRRVGGERDKIESIREIVCQANELLSGWKDFSAQRKNSLKWDLAWIIGQLENCRNEHKKNILSQIKAMAGFKDNLNRTNPGAMAARSLAALADLYRRFEELNIIPAKIRLRRRILIWEKDRLDILFSYCSDQINFFTLHQSFFGAKLSLKQKEILCQKIDQVISLLQTALASPYWERANGAKDRLYEAKIALGQNQSKCRLKLIDSMACLTNLPESEVKSA